MTLPRRIQAIVTEHIRIRGLVQGVGFRPMVYQLAQQWGLCGQVCNDNEGVLITAQAIQADAAHIDDFINDLRQHKPPLARIDSIERTTISSDTEYPDFSIQRSHSGAIHTGVVADAATCPECLQDIFDPNNRRYGYAFTNCTHCGPRLSIVRNIPYDRAQTSMDSFTLCPTCQQEYDDPLDRRFHAQPNACPDCGPTLALWDRQGNVVNSSDPIAQTAAWLQAGQILAIKGIGGFHLACDASNDDAIQQLRQRKHRPHKALALMARDVAQIKQYCFVSDAEEQALSSPAAPILILQIHQGAPALSEHLAPGQNTLGFMLPYSPLHHLLMQQLEHPLVMTSGNASDAPQCIDNTQALEQLSAIADYFLLHNRDIINRIDDSVVRVINSTPQFYRRARGYAPTPLLTHDSFPADLSLLACGAELKNTFALYRDAQVTLSQHMGNLEHFQTYQDYLKNIALYQRLFQFEPQAIVIDAHPEYLSSKWGRQFTSEHDLPLIEVQHHHAHIAACLADNHWPLNAGPVLGVALDGLGYGLDGSLWGGEFLLADYGHYQRLGHFKPVPLPGGQQAMLEPWRNTFAQLYHLYDWLDLDHQYGDLNLLQYLHNKPIEVLKRMIDNNMNAPMSSSAGRLFDAVAAALGLCPDRISYEGQAAIELEALVDANLLAQTAPYPFTLEDGDCLQINFAPMWQAVLRDLAKQTTTTAIATRFHATVAHSILAMTQALSQRTQIHTVALSGGVFQNASLLKLTCSLLTAQGHSVLTHRQVPANDGGLSLGQAAVAASLIATGGVSLCA